MGERHRWGLAVAAVATVALCGSAPAGARRGSLAVARTARTLKAHDMASLHYVSASGSTLYEVGAASGTLPGGMHVHMQLSTRFTGSFVIYAHGGSILGSGSATPHGSGTYESFAGTLSVTGGTGRFGHAHGTAKLYGVFNRKSYALTIQTTGTLYY